MDLGFRIRAQGSGFRIRIFFLIVLELIMLIRIWGFGLGFRVQGFGFRIQGFGFRIRD